MSNEIKIKTRLHFPLYESFALACLILIGAGVYLQTLQYDFVWDDHRHILENPALNDPWIIPQSFTDFGQAAHFEKAQLLYRPVFLLSLAADAAFWGKNPVGFHLTNILLHAFVTLLIFEFLRKWTGSFRIAWISSAVFAVHPIHVESVAWISARAELLMCLFLLVSFLAFSRSCDSSGIKSWGWTLAEGLAFLTALLSKETAIVFPGLIVLICYSRKLHSWKSVLPSLIITILISLGYLFSRSSTLLTVDSRSWYESGMAILYVTGEYLRLLLFPVSLKALYDLPSLTFMDQWVIRSVVILGIWVIGLVVAMRRSPIIFSAMTWVLISLVPAYSLFMYTSVSPIAERLLYLPSIGFALLCGMLLSTMYDRFGSQYLKPIATGIVMFLLCAYAIGTMHSNKAWANEQRLWENTVHENPENSLAHFNLATAYFDRKQWQKAIQEYQKAVSIKPVYPEAYSNIGNAYSELGSRDLAIEQYKTAIRQKATYGDAYNNLAVTYHEIGRDDLAQKTLESAVQMSPMSADVHNNLGNVFTVQKQWEKAIEQYEEALRLKPNYPEARLNLERAHRMGK